MKKLSYVLVAAAVVMSAASCEKISDLVNGVTENEQGLVDDKGKDLTPDEQKVKIEETANTLMDLMDKKGWEDEYNKVNATIDALGEKEVDSEEIGTYLSNIVNAWTSMRGDDPNQVAVTVAHLTDIKGHFTENKDGKFDFTEADDLAITVFEGNVPVTVTFSAKDEAKVPAHFADKDDDVTIFIPGTSYLGISKNNEGLASLELRLKPTDVNNDGVITEEDKIDVSYTMKVGTYTFELSQANYATTNASASAQILKGKQLIIGASVSAKYEYEEVQKEDYTNIEVKSASGEAMVDLAGKTQIRFTVPDAIALQNVSDEMYKAQDKNDGEAFKAALEQLEKLYGFGVYYDGKKTLQATLGFEAVNIDNYWDVNPVIRFADGTSYAVEDYFTEERFGELVQTIQEWVADLMKYLGLEEQPAGN
jgi:hypothetical protein